MHLRGASVAVLDLDADQAREAAERIGPRAIGIAADVTDQGAMMAAVAEVVEKLRRRSTSPSPTPASPRRSWPPPAGSPARNGSGSSRSTCSASGARCARRCRRSSSGAARWSSSPPSTPSSTAWATAPTRSPRPGSSRSAARCGSSWPRTAPAPPSPTSAGSTPNWSRTPSTSPTPAASASSRPDFLLKRITPDEAGAGLVRGIEERAPRIFVPKWWRYVSALRGLINPLLDRRMESDAKMAAPDRATSTPRDSVDAERASRLSRCSDVSRSSRKMTDS